MTRKLPERSSRYEHQQLVNNHHFGYLGGRRGPYVAVQQRMGLLSERGARIDPGNIGRSDARRPHLKMLDTLSSGASPDRPFGCFAV
jgi:hypothetical protein